MEIPGSGIASLSILAGNNQSGTVNTRLSVPFTVQVKDAAGLGYAGATIDWTLVSGDGTLSSTSSVSNSAGAAFTYLDLPAFTDSQTVVATLHGSDPELSVTFSSSSTPIATVMSLVATPSSVTAGVPLSADVTLYDSFGNVRSDYVGTLTLEGSDPLASIPSSYTFTSGPGGGTDNGTHTFSVTFRSAGSHTLTILDAASGLTRTAIVTVLPAPASRLRISNDLNSTEYLASSSLTSLTLEALDPWDNLDTNYNRPVSVSINPNPGAASLSGTTSRSAVAGRVTFPGLSISKTGNGNKLKFDSTNAMSAPLIPASTSFFDILANTPTSVVTVAGYSSQGTVDTSLGNLSVLVLDAYLNPVPNIAVAWNSSGGGNFTPSASLSNASGVATTSFTLPTEAGPLTVSGTHFGAVSLTDSFSIEAKGAAAQSLMVSGHASPNSAGVQRSVTVTARDAYGNLASNYTGIVQISSSDTQAVLPAAAQLTSSSGNFNVTLKTSGSQSITATDTVTSSITGSQSAISVAPTAATHFLVSGFPSTVNSYTGGTVTVTAQDAYDNTATAYAGNVHFTSSDAEAVLPADASLSSGTKSFSVTFKNPGSQSITASDSVSASITGTQSGITVNPGPAVSFTVSGFSTSPTAGVSGTVTVTARDLYGKPATGYTGTVHLSSTDGQAVLAADSTLSNGVGTFAVTLKTMGTQSITATDTLSGSITGAQSGIAVSAAALQKATYTTAPRTSAFSSQPLNPVVQAQDAFGNAIKTTHAMQLAMYDDAGCDSTLSSGSLSVASGTSDSNGNWVPAGVKFSGLGAHYLRASVSGAAQTACSPVTITAPVVDPALSTVVVSAGSARLSISTISVTVNVRDTESNPIANISVSVASNRGATDSITSAHNTNAAGQAVFYISSATRGQSVLTTTTGAVVLNLKPIIYFLNDNPMADFTAPAAESGMTPGSNSPFYTSSWRNRAGSALGDGQLSGFAMTASSGWSGNGGVALASDPYQLNFDGSTSSNINLGVAAQDAGLIETFVRMPASINTEATRGRVLMSNASSINSGFTLRHSNRGASQIAASQSLPLELVNGNASYSDFVRRDGAFRYWINPTGDSSTSLDETMSGTVLQSVGADDVNNGGFGANNGCRDGNPVWCQFFGTEWANSYPNQGVQVKRFVSGGYSYSTTNIPATSSGALSFETWTKIDNAQLGITPAGTAKAVIASKRNGGGLIWALYVYRGKLYWNIQGQTLVSTSSLVVDNWYHVAVTQSGSTATLYINGTQDAQTTFASFTLSDQAAPISIGRDSSLTSTGTGVCNNWEYGATCTYRGYITHVALYERALTSTEIGEHYAARSAQSCEIAQLPRANEWQYVALWSGTSTGLVASLTTSTTPVGERNFPSRCRVTVSAVAGASRAFKTSTSDLIVGSSLSSQNLWQGGIGELRVFPVASFSEDTSKRYCYPDSGNPTLHWFPPSLYSNLASCDAAVQSWLSSNPGFGYPSHYTAEKPSYP